MEGPDEMEEEETIERVKMAGGGSQGVLPSTLHRWTSLGGGKV